MFCQGTRKDKKLKKMHHINEILVHWQSYLKRWGERKTVLPTPQNTPIESHIWQSFSKLFFRFTICSPFADYLHFVLNFVYFPVCCSNMPYIIIPHTFPTLYPPTSKFTIASPSFSAVRQHGSTSPSTFHPREFFFKFIHATSAIPPSMLPSPSSFSCPSSLALPSHHTSLRLSPLTSAETPSATSAAQFNNISTAEFLNTYLGRFLSFAEVSVGLETVQRLVSIHLNP